MRDALAAWCPPAKTLEQQLNASFAAQLPKAIKKRRWRLAIDLNLRPYDGQAHRRAEARYRRQAKSGTTPFHAYATGYLVHPGRPYPVALTPGEQGTAWVEGVKQRWPGASRAGVPPSLLLRDRGCYRVAVIRYPQAARYPCLMPVIGRGRKPLHPQGPSGTQGFAGWKRRGGAPYPLSRADHQHATVSLCVQCRNWRGRRQRHGRPTRVSAFWGRQPTTPHWVFEIYRYRFGIETCYRQLGEAGLKPTTRNPTLRWLFVGIALLLRNGWGWLHGVYLASPRRGNRQLNLHKRRFKTLLLWLTHLAEEPFGINDTVVVERVP